MRLPYINLKPIQLFTIGVLTLILAACGSTPEKTTELEPTSATANNSPDTIVPGEAPQLTFDLGGPDTNPYLEQASDAPAPARALFNDAVKAMQAEQWSRAETLLQSLIGQYPDLSGPYLNLGIVYRHLNQMDKAKEAFAKAVTVNSMNIDALNQLALINREQGDFKAAETHYLSALAVWPKHDTTHKNLGILYDLYMGELTKALEQFEMFQFLQPEPDRRVAGWIIDLQRRISNEQAGTQ